MKHVHHREWSQYFEFYRDDRTLLLKLIEHWGYHLPAYDHLLRRLTKSARILDVGCGIGGTAIYLAGAGHECLGIDSEGQVVKRAREIGASLSSKARFAVADARRLACAADSFDATLSLGVLEHFTDDDFVAALSEQRRVARLVLTVLPTRFMALGAGVQDERFFDRATLQSLHRAAGLKVLEMFGYGSPAGTGKMPHVMLGNLLPTPLLLLLERKLGYAMQIAVLATRAAPSTPPSQDTSNAVRPASC